MKKELLTGNGAAAWGARLSNIDYVPAFPITPQTEIIETLSEWMDQNKMTARMTMMDSEHSMITAAGAAAVTGVRVFSATSSQGLLYALEMLYAVAGWRVPFVLVNVSRGLAAPITLEPDHNDIFAARDSGFLQIHCATCQEVLDCILIAYRLAEEERIRLPVIVNLDGFYLSFTREAVVIPDPQKAKTFVGNFSTGNTQLRGSSPLSHAAVVLSGSAYSYFRYETHLAAQHALTVFPKICAEFQREFGRDYAEAEAYCLEDADYVFVMIGSFATKAKAAVDLLRGQGWKIGLLRPRLLRPFPETFFREKLAGKKGVAVIDQNISMGKGGILYTELLSALYHLRKNAPIVVSFIGGLGGRNITDSEFLQMAQVLEKTAATGEVPPPRLLFTTAELNDVRKMQETARSGALSGGDA